MTQSKDTQWPSKLVLATAVCAMTHSVFAQETPQTEETIVTGSYQSSLQEALDMKRESTRVADGISAQDIGSFPSENIAEAIQRIPGVQISNVNGRGATISVRGLGPQFANTTLNGQTFKSADFTSGFRFDIIQTELASDIQVIKSPSADMDAGGLSGTININTAKPLDFSNRKILASIKGQKSEYSPTGDVTPKANITYLDQFNEGEFGILLNAGFQKLDDRVDNFWMDRWIEDEAGNNTTRRPRFRRIDRETERQMFNGTFQWQPSDNLDMSLNAVFASDEIDQDLNQQVFLFQRSDSIITTEEVPTNGYYRTAIIENSLLENNRQIEERNLKSSAITADMSWTNDIWTVSGVLHTTSGEADISEEAAILGVKIPLITFDISDRGNVIMDTHNTDLSDPSLYTHTEDSLLPRNEYPNGASRLVESSEDAIQLDVKRAFEEGIFTGISAGIKYRSESFDRDVKRRDRYIYGDEGTAAPENLPSMAEYGFLVSGFLDGEMSIPHAWVAPNIQAYRDALVAEGFDVESRQIHQNSYGIDRDVFATYIKADFMLEIGNKVIRGDAGVRYEGTDRTLSTNLTAPNPDDEEGNLLIGTEETPFDYSNVLPNLNVVLEMSDSVQLRFAIAKALVRPIITSRTNLAQTESVSSNSEGTDTYSINLGQPDMKPLTSDQLDFGVEYYYGDNSGLTFNAFYKSVKNGSVEEEVCPGSYNGANLLLNDNSDCVDSAGNLYEIVSTFNADTKTKIKGYEIGWNQSFDDILPVTGFGVTANYTNINADSDEDGFQLADLSRETWNFTGYWENETFSVRGSLNHRSPYISQILLLASFLEKGEPLMGAIKLMSLPAGTLMTV